MGHLNKAWKGSWIHKPTDEELTESIRINQYYREHPPELKKYEDSYASIQCGENVTITRHIQKVVGEDLSSDEFYTDIKIDTEIVRLSVRHIAGGCEITINNTHPHYKEIVKILRNIGGQIQDKSYGKEIKFSRTKK